MCMSHAAAKSSTPAALALGRIVFEALTHDPHALRILIACTLAVVATAIEPPYLSLSTPEIQTQLRTPGSAAPLFIATAFLTVAVIMLIAGTSGDLFGRRLFLLIGVAGVTLSNILGFFTIGTALFPLIDGFNTLTTAIVMPMAIAIVTLTFSTNVRPFAYGMVFGFQGVGFVISPILMALFERIQAPQWAFLPAIIIGLFAFWLALRHVPESRSVGPQWRAGAIVNLVLLASIFIVVFLVLTSPTLFQTWQPLLVALGMLILVILFARWLIRRVQYFKGVQLFTGRDTAFAILAGVMLSVGQGAFFYQFATFNQEIQDVNPLTSALRMVPFILGLLSASFLIARLALRFGARRIIVGGMILMGIGFIWLSLMQVGTPYWFILIPVILMGFGFGLATPARTQVVLSAPPITLVGSAAGVNAAAGQLGYALGVVLSSVMVTQLADFHFLRNLDSLDIPSTVIAQLRQALPDLIARLNAVDWSALPQGVGAAFNTAYAQAFTIGMGQTFLVLGIGSLLGAIAIYFGMERGLKATVAMPLDELVQNDQPKQ